MHGDQRELTLEPPKLAAVVVLHRLALDHIVDVVAHRTIRPVRSRRSSPRGSPSVSVLRA
jgi:hypothetical protein